MEGIKPMENGASRHHVVKVVCPLPEELSVITNNVKCEKCGLAFKNEPRYRLHDLKVHQHKNLSKATKNDSARYHCPVESCVYAVNTERYFASMKYLKQHYLKVHAEKTHACVRCDKCFSTEAAKEGHMRICGIEFTCSCSKTYTSYEALLTHAKRSLHTINEKYKNLLRRASSKRIEKLILSTTSQTEINKLITILPTTTMPTTTTTTITTTTTPTTTTKTKTKTTTTTMTMTTNRDQNVNIVSKRSMLLDIATQTDDEYPSGKRNKRPSGLLGENHRHQTTIDGYYYQKEKCAAASKQTQTENRLLEKVKQKVQASMETQTMFKNSLKLPPKHAMTTTTTTRNCSVVASQNSDYTLLKDDLHLENSLGNFASSNLFPNSPLPLRHDDDDDDGLRDFWEDKSTSGTQTISSSSSSRPEKDMFQVLNDNVTQTEFDAFYDHGTNPLIQSVTTASTKTGVTSTVALMTLPTYVEEEEEEEDEETSAVEEGYQSSFAPSNGIASRSDPMLTDKTTRFADKFSSIETQTEQAIFSQSFFSDSDPFAARSFALSSTIETQTNNLDDDNMEQLLYSNTCTQTCNNSNNDDEDDEMLPSDLGLSNCIQTQTPWSQLEVYCGGTVSAETQTKSLICETGCDVNIPLSVCRSWLSTQTSHTTETQTDLFSIFEGL